MTQNFFSDFETKMRAAGMSRAAIAAFERNYSKLLSGETGMIPEAEIQPVPELPEYGEIALQTPADPSLLSKTLIVKLNGGLGTSMGLEKAKSLLEVKNGFTFLDLIARQVLHLRAKHRTQLRFMLMNSFSTSRDTVAFLSKYSELGAPSSLELMQNQVPKVDAKTLRPVSWPENPELEWCPPGHGDFYTALYGSGTLDRLLAEGVNYVFISNSDNLGATLDLPLLTYFAKSDLGFMMEAAARTAADKKGGHLAMRKGALLLRESAQSPDGDMSHFQDVTKHRFFNTNNLWVRLDQLKSLLERNGGFLPLPLIKNSKTVDPRKKSSPKVFQLETAMGAAIECFEKAGAVVVPRSRFAPVKTTSDLLALRSDAYRLAEDWRIVLDTEGRIPEPPQIELDPDYYKLVDGLDELLCGAAPSLRACRALSVKGPLRMASGVTFSGSVRIVNSGPERKMLPSGNYANCEWKA